MSEEVKDVTVIEEEETKESSIDLDKLDKINEPEEELDEVEKLKKQLAAEKKAREEAELARERDKAARDKAMRERAALSRAIKEKEKALEEPNEELEKLRQEIAARDLEKRKTDLLLAATDRLAINQENAKTLVNAVYHPDTNEVDIESLVDSFTTIINDARKIEFEKGYNRRDTEIASGKPRSIGSTQADATPDDEALARYLQKYGRKKR